MTRESIEAYLARGGTITKCPTMPARGLMEIERITGVCVSYLPAPPDATVSKADEARARGREIARLSGNESNKAKGRAMLEAVKVCRSNGMNKRQVMNHLGISETTVKRYSRIMRDEAVR
jgi:hypothetical protein